MDELQTLSVSSKLDVSRALPLAAEAVLTCQLPHSSAGLDMDHTVRASCFEAVGKSLTSRQRTRGWEVEDQGPCLEATLPNKHSVFT